uniref:Uncharacterized protein n=1 Tax=Arundo donax TaxID=35708 RepID=A0A0A9D3Z6_ARUDO
MVLSLYPGHQMALAGQQFALHSVELLKAELHPPWSLQNSVDQNILFLFRLTGSYLFRPVAVDFLAVLVSGGNCLVLL